MRLGAERRMTARKDEPQPVIAESAVVLVLRDGGGVRLGAGDLAALDLGAEHDIAADAVNRFIAAGPDQPRARIFRYALRRPLFHSGDERFLPRLFG